MYRIKTQSGDSFLIELPTYVRRHSSGKFLLTDKNHADGVAYHGNFYLFSDGAQVCEVDAGELTQESVELLNTLLTGEV